LLVISTINGHGAISIGNILRVLEEYQVKRVTTIVAGGLLTTDPATAVAAEAKLLELGCAGVFVGDSAWERFDEFLKRRNMHTGCLLPMRALFVPKSLFEIAISMCYVELAGQFLILKRSWAGRCLLGACSMLAGTDTAHSLHNVVLSNPLKMLPQTGSYRTSPRTKNRRCRTEGC